MKAALLGAGEAHFNAHLKTLQVLPEVESIQVWGDDREALTALEGEAKVDGLHSDLDAMLGQNDIFFAIASVRSDIKPALFSQLLDAGIHLMAEKPMGTSTEAVAKLVEKAEGAGLALGTCYQNRYHPVNQKIRSLVADGTIGDLMSIEMRMLTTQPKFRNPGGWLFQKEIAGGGMLAWLGCHYIDLMRYLTSDEIVSVSAEVATRSGEDIDVEDIAVLSMRLRSGAIGSLHTGYTLSLKGDAYGETPGYDTYIGLNGRHGRMMFDAEGGPSHLYVESTTSNWSNAPVQEYDFVVGQSPAYAGVPGEAFIRDFILAAQGKGEGSATGRDALQVARVIDAAYESSRTGRRIDIEAP
jgi:predicted dehydrogenase